MRSICSCATLCLLGWFTLVIAHAEEPKPAKKPPVAKTDGQPPPAHVTIGKDTTFVTGPVREDGTIDFVAAINEHAKVGVTAENNAAIPFWQIVGPSEIEEKLRTRYFQELGTEVPPADGDYFTSFSAYLDLVAAGKAPGTEQLTDENPERAQEKRTRIEDQQTTSHQRPWKVEEFPIVAAWLAKNDELLDTLAEATKLSRFYSPTIVEDEETGSLATLQFTSFSPARAVGRALVARAMLRLGTGNLETAQVDLLACHRLARFIAGGELLIDSLVGIAIDGLANTGDHGLAHSGKLTSKQLLAYGKQVQALPAWPTIIERINFGERLFFIDNVVLVARLGAKGLEEVVGSAEDSPTTAFLQRVISQGTDWDTVLRRGNGWYDRLVLAGRETDIVKQRLALKKFDEDFRSVAQSASNFKSFAVLALAKGLKEAATEKTGDILIALTLPATNAALNAEYRARVYDAQTQIVLALAAYRADLDEYPAELATLQPKYLAAIPLDRFSGKPFLYSATKAGYLLYSVGPNGEDDGGRSKYVDENEQNGDDLAVRYGQP